MENQDFLRQQVKLAKALNDDWNYKQIAETINISKNAFYNWLNGAYQLSYNKEKQLIGLLSNLIDEY